MEDDTFMYIAPTNPTYPHHFAKKYTIGNPTTDAPTYNLPTTLREQTQIIRNVILTVTFAEIYEYNEQINISTKQNNQEQECMSTTATENKTTNQDDD